MRTKCKECDLFFVEADTDNQKIEPSHTKCRECMRLDSLEERQTLTEKARVIYKTTGMMSTSLLRRKLKVTYEKARRIINDLERADQNE